MIKRAFLALVLAAIGVTGVLAYQAKRLTRDPVSISTPQLYSVVRGATLRSVLGDWQRRGWWEPGRWGQDAVVATLRIRGLDSRLQAGEYELRPGRNVLQLVAEIVAGHTHQYALTIIEGWTFADLRRHLANTPALRVVTADMSGDAIMRELGQPGVHPEGRFLPETYLYERGESDLAVLARAASALQRALDSAWEERAAELPLQTPEALLTLASIVEKETAVADERPEIAGVFVNRLRRGMRLQTDPTVIYGLGDSYKGDITFKHLRTDTPYNTYTRSGLPPTPIALPSLASLQAAAHPAATDALYFVAAGDGHHIFSATLEAHNRAVDRYQRRRR